MQFAGDQKTALTGESLYSLFCLIPYMLSGPHWFVMIMTSLKSVALTDFLLQTLELMKLCRNGVKATKGGEFLFLCITKLHTLKDTNIFYQ